jgi:hypothetical protein
LVDQWEVQVRSSVARVLFAVLLGALFAPTAAQAFPGANGKIVFESANEIWVMNPDGSVAAVAGDTNPLNGDQADVTLGTGLTDIQTGAGADYNPNPSGADLTQVTRLRLTDQANGYGGISATASDFDFTLPIDCVPTVDPLVGSACTASTTADTLMGGFAQEQRQTVTQVFRVRIYDSGLNGARQDGTGDDRVFAHGGIFTP